MKKNIYFATAAAFRQKAELLLKRKKSKISSTQSRPKMLKLISELEVHKNELELQNQELMLAHEQAMVTSKKFIELYDSAPTGYFTLSRSGEIIQINFAGAALLGKDRSQLLNQFFHLFVSNDTKSIFNLFCEKVFSSNNKESCELILSSDNNVPIFVYLTGIVSENEGNCFVNAIDITERKHLESKLAESKVPLNETMWTGKIGGWAFNVETLTQTWTHEIFDILELDTAKGEPKASETIEFIDEPFRQTAEIAIKRAIEFGEPFGQEWKVTTAKGNKRWINTVGKTKIVKGKTISLSGSFQDITERKQAEEALLKSESVHRKMVANIGDVIVIIDKDGINRYKSPNVEKIFGWKPEELIGARAWENVHPEDNKSIQNFFKSLIVEPNLTGTYEFRYRCKDGSYKWIGFTGINLLDDPEIKGILGNYRDISIRKESESFLRESEHFLQNTQTIANLGTYSLDVTTGLWTSSEILDKIFGISKDDIRSVEGWVSIIHPDWKEIMSNYLILDVLGKKAKFDKEYQIIRQNDKSVRWVHGIGNLQFDKENQVVSMLGIIWDITEQKRNEELLKASETKYHAIFENVQDVFYQTDLDGTILEVSPSIEKILGFSRDEIIGKPIAKLSFDFKSRDMFLYKLKENGELRDYELRLKTKTREFKYTSINARLIFDADGMANHIEGAIRDITQRKLAQVELKASMEFLKNIINAVASPVFVKDDNHKFILVNNALCSLFNLPIEKIIGTTGYEYIPEEQMKVFIAKDKEVIETGIENENEEFITDGKGNIRTIITRKTLYTDTPGNKFLVGVVNDITERKLAEKQIKRLNRVYSVLSNINQTIIRNRDKQLLFDEACRITVDHGGFLMAWIGIVNSATSKVDVVASSGKTEEYLEHINIDLNDKAFGSGPTGLAIKTGKCFFSNNIETDDKMIPWRKNAKKYGYRSSIALPLTVMGKTVGAYIIYSGEIDFFNEEEIELLKELASDISFALEFIENEMERKQVVEALKENNSRLELAMQSANMAWWEMDITTGNVIFDKRKTEMIGYPVKEFKHYKDFMALVHPEDADKTMKAMKKHIDGLAGKYETEYRILTNSSEYKWFYDIGSIVKKDTSGKALCVTGLVIDINERKLMEQALQASEEKYHTIFNNVQDVFYQTDLDGIIIDVSPSVKNYSEYTRDEIIGKSATDLYYDLTDRVELMDRLMNKGEVRDYELRIKSKNGSYKYASINARLIFDVEGNPDHIDGAIRDISDRKLVQEKLTKSEERFKLAMNASNNGLFDWNIETNEIYYSPGWKKIIGYKDHELPNDFSVWEEKTDPLDIKNFWELQQKLISKKIDRFVLEFKMKHKDGSWVDILSKARAVFNENGKAIRIVGTHTNISERKKAEEALRESNRILIESQAMAHLGSYITDLTSNEFEANAWKASPEIYKIFGIDKTYPHTLAGWAGFIHPDSREELLAYHYQVVTKGKRFDHEYKIVRINDGTERWVHGTGELEFDDQRKPIRMMGTIQDITERKQVETSLMIFKTAIEKSEVSVVITDKNGNIEYANPFFTKLTGYSANEYIGQNPRILSTGHHSKAFFEEMWNTIKSGNTWNGELYNRKKNGDLYWENAIISAIENDKKQITHLVAIKTDITESKQINSELIIAKERAEESDRLKSAFLANMSHEIRTPMNGILGFTELLKEPDLSEDQQKYFISIIEKSGERLLNIINDIIDISKIESGQMKVKKSEINVNEYLEQILNFFSPEAETKNIKLICKVGLPIEEAFLKTDSEKFYAILINLVKNALKYTKTGFIEFGYNREPNHSYLQFYVKDTGIGIPKDRQEAIFERFVQADIFDKMARQGAGLGLSISKAYVEMLKGKIWLESEEENLSAGKSGCSTFYFTLPYYSKPIEVSNVGIEILIPENEIHINNLKILIAEDDEPSRELASIAVMKFGKEIIKAQTGKEAVEACRNNPDIDLVLMDIQMPEMNGYEATHQIRQFNTKVIIIAVTAFALTGDREQAIEAGCTDYISKPIKIDELQEIIQKHLGSVN